MVEKELSRERLVERRAEKEADLGRRRERKGCWGGGALLPLFVCNFGFLVLDSSPGLVFSSLVMFFL
jgi:hypothetical protein